jgi:hypothetical protein
MSQDLWGFVISQRTNGALRARILSAKEKFDIVSGAASPRRFPAGVSRRRWGRRRWFELFQVFCTS